MAGPHHILPSSEKKPHKGQQRETRRMWKRIYNPVATMPGDHKGPEERVYLLFRTRWNNDKISKRS